MMGIHSVACFFSRSWMGYWGEQPIGAKADKYRELFKTNTPKEVPSAAQSNESMSVPLVLG